ncbi:MAG TPA: alpha/beta hydrolase, partial [Acidimicrobiales bacterium]|nr:alpha/beta hydrolase [Acidimicrobiales bacterium]
MTLPSAEFALVHSNDGVAIAHLATGDGPPLVLIGGALSTRSSLGPLADALAHRFQAITYDRRGRGDSGDGLYSVDREIEDLAALLDAFGGECAVYGHSSGGILALRAAAAGLGISRLAIYEPPLIAPTQPLASVLIPAIRSLLVEGRRSEAVETFLREAVQTPPPSVERAKASEAWPILESIAPTLIYDLAISGAEAADPMPPLGGITTPVLVLDGGLSPVVLRDIAVEVAGELANARHATIPDQRHNPTVDALAPVLTGFFTT